MILDGHVHVGAGEPDPDHLLARMQAAGVSGGIVISRPPPCFGRGGEDRSAEPRLANLLAWTRADAELYPFFWIDPTEDGVRDQVALAVGRGVAGFKVICGDHYPGDARAMPAYRAVAEAGRPILFHSGILWDGKPSSTYCRPAGFEALLEVPGLRFALAHISWPWCDELIAVYGKFQSALRSRDDLTAEMFVDLTPGTPPIYRREALTKLLTVGYDVERNVVFGTDCNTARYDAEWARQWIERDTEIYGSLGLGEDVQRRVFAENLRRFVGAR